MLDSCIRRGCDKPVLALKSGLYMLPSADLLCVAYGNALLSSSNTTFAALPPLGSICWTSQRPCQTSQAPRSKLLVGRSKSQKLRRTPCAHPSGALRGGRTGSGDSSARAPESGRLWPPATGPRPRPPPRAPRGPRPPSFRSLAPRTSPARRRSGGGAGTLGNLVRPVGPRASRKTCSKWRPTPRPRRPTPPDAAQPPARRALPPSPSQWTLGLEFQRHRHGRAAPTWRTEIRMTKQRQARRSRISCHSTCER